MLSRKRFFELFFFTLMLFSLLISSGSQTAQAQEVAKIEILEIDKSQFPDVEVTFRPINSTGQVPTNLTQNNIDIYENGQLVSDFEVVPDEIAPAYVYYVIDRGVYSNFAAYNEETLQQSLKQFLDGGHFRDGVDTVAIYTLENDSLGRATENNPTPPPGSSSNDKFRAKLNPINSASAFSSAIDSLDWGATTGTTRGLKGVDDAITSLLNTTAPDAASTVVIYLSSLIQSPGPAAALTQAGELGIKALQLQTPVYTFHAHSQGQWATPLKELSKQSGGSYLLLSTEADNNLNGLDRLYADIIAQGQTYKAKFRSTQGASGTRSVNILPKGSTYTTEGEDTYEISLLAPEIVITSPRDNSEIVRDVEESEPGNLTYDVDSAKVTAEIASWPDNILREAAYVEFFVDGVSALRVDNPESDLFRFDLDLTDYDELGVTALPIVVRVVDELGIAGESSATTLNVKVDDILTIPPTSTPGPTPTPTILDKCKEFPDDPECVQEEIMGTVPWGLAILLLIALVVVLVLYRRKVSAFAGRAGDFIQNQVEEVRKTILGGRGAKGKTVLAKLYVLNARRDLIGGEIKIFTRTTTIGRNPKLCDIQLFDEDDISSVSGQHCTIMFDQDTFYITDDNSANGTEINGTPIPSSDPYKLNDGDEIVLGDLFRRGAKLRFERVVDSQESSVVDDYDFPAGGFTTGGDIDLNDDTILGDEDDFLETDYDLPVFDDDSFDDDQDDEDWLEQLD